MDLRGRIARVSSEIFDNRSFGTIYIYNVTSLLELRDVLREKTTAGTYYYDFRASRPISKRMWWQRVLFKGKVVIR